MLFCSPANVHEFNLHYANHGPILSAAVKLHMNIIILIRDVWHLIKLLHCHASLTQLPSNGRSRDELNERRLHTAPDNTNRKKPPINQLVCASFCTVFPHTAHHVTSDLCEWLSNSRTPWIYRPAQTSCMAFQSQLIALEVSVVAAVVERCWTCKNLATRVSWCRLADGRCGWRSRFPIAEMTGRHKWAGMCEWQEAWHLRPWGGRPLCQWAKHLRAGIQSGFSLFLFFYLETEVEDKHGLTLKLLQLFGLRCEFIGH